MEQYKLAAEADGNPGFAQDDKGIARNGELLDTFDGKYKVVQLQGTVADGFTRIGEACTVNKLLCPLESTPIIQCVGLNYRKHAKEAKLEIPLCPVIFTKPGDALAGPSDEIPIHKDAQQQLDFEGELCVIIGKDAKDVTEDNALDYVLGYCVGNDVSARNFQLPAVSGGQFCYAKSFDRFAPIGPAIWSSAAVRDPQNLRYVTKVNGQIMQETGTDDMIWPVSAIIHHLSRGTTLRRGTVIMTGTPSGVGFFRNLFLRDGDIVEVELDGLGKISNTIRFE